MPPFSSRILSISSSSLLPIRTLFTPSIPSSFYLLINKVAKNNTAPIRTYISHTSSNRSSKLKSPSILFASLNRHISTTPVRYVNELDISSRISLLEDKLSHSNKTIEELTKVTREGGQGLTKAFNTLWIMSGMAVIYFVFVTGWMTLMINDLIGHMHGIPVVRMITVAQAKKGNNNNNTDVGLPPDSGFTEANTQLEPHLATEK